MYDIFSLPDALFPKDFLWGSATAGHQIEGDNIHSAHWADEMKMPPDPTGINRPSGKACNHYNMVEEDTDIMTSLSMKGHRMSIEWSRIEPEEGVFCDEAIDHYLRELSLLRERGIKVFLTLNHFSCPKWFADMGGIADERNLRYFERFIDKIAPLYAPYVDAWLVLNEFNLGMAPEDMKRKHHFLKYHAIGYHTVKKHTDAPVSSAHAMVMFDPARRYDKFDRISADYYDMCANEFFFHAIRTGEVILPPWGGAYDPDMKGTADFWAINIYTRSMVDARREWFLAPAYDHRRLRMIPMDFYLEELEPEVMIHQLTRLTDRPVYITENGCSCDDDDFRIVYIALYLSALRDAMDRGVDVRGYFYWSLLDNYEWGSFVPRFGLTHVDFDTFERRIKRSGYFFRDIIERGGVTQDIIRRYLDKMPTLRK